MHTESIQNPHAPLGSSPERACRWRHVADLFGLPLTTGQLEELAGLDDRTAVARFLPHLADVERAEVLWALAA